MWLPYIILSFPGLTTPDTIDQLSQFFHRSSSWTIKSINLLNENVFINKHHSVFHTIVLGVIFKIGNVISSFTLGAFIYTILQLILFLMMFSYIIVLLKKNNVSNIIIFLFILFVSLNPTIVTYVLCAVKDTPSAIFNLFYVIFLLQIVRDIDSIYKDKLKIILFSIIIMMVLLLRNNGIYTFMLSFPWLFLIYKISFKKLLLTFVVPLLLFFVYDSILLPSYDVSDGSIRESLSIPVMQVARVIRDKNDEITQDDIEIIDNVFTYDAMKRFYRPEISDPVKNHFNKDATNKEIKLFFGLWFKYLKKYPLIYIESVINSTSGYFFPDVNSDELYIENYILVDESYFNIIRSSKYADYRIVLNKLIKLYYKLPIFINKVAYYDWLLLFSCVYIIIKKKYKYLIPLTPLLAVLLSCIASPLNGSYRYILPIIFAVPIIILIDYIVYKESVNN